jgi:carbon-monoxide dehydrogenase medium subunit
LTGQSYTDGTVRLGALTCHADLLRSELVRRHLPLLTQAAPHIGHIAIRNRGTLGGSLAYADPAAELPACAVALDATLVLRGLSGEREVEAESFYKGLFETDLRPGELIVAVRFPAMGSGVSSGFDELSRRHGDFAMAGLAATAQIEGNDIKTARLVYFGCTSHPKVARVVGEALMGSSIPLRNGETLDAAISKHVKPDDTPGLRAATRLQMAKVLTRRVINSMGQRAAA